MALWRLLQTCSHFMTLIPSTFVRSQWSHFFNSYKKIWNYVRFKIFASLENDAKIEKIGKNIFFCWKLYFFYLNLNCTCSQLSFEVYNIYIAQNFKFRLFLPWKFFVANLCDSASPNVKNIILRGLFLVFLESQRPILSSKIKFGPLGGLLA